MVSQDSREVTSVYHDMLHPFKVGTKFSMLGCDLCSNRDNDPSKMNLSFTQTFCMLLPLLGVSLNY